MSPYLGPLRAFTAGFVDTVGFVALFGLFTAHVTGNFVLIGASIAEFHGGIVAKLIALPVFIAAVALTHLFVTQRQRRGVSPVAALTLFEALFLAAFMASGLAANPFTAADSPAAIATGMLAVTAMAIQNAGARSVFAALSPTTVMTGNVTQIVIDAVDLVAAPDKAAAAKARLTKMLPPVLAFASGALAGGLGYVHVGFWSLLLPLSAVMSAWWLLRRSAVPSA
ncbi:YoaK family protein [Dongia sp.]|uniref:YoaK family protein n=1 Tax=Dongia sp. TaxID=1977262 RepID=UPI0035B3CD9C